MSNLPLPVISAFLLAIIAFCFLYKGKTGLAVFSLFIAGLVVRLWAAHLDPFLHDWDERFHALVARNMMDDPFKPMLRKAPVSNELVLDWCCNRIWLHKQPLFLWQMVLSMKIFGISPFAIRYPSALEGALLVVMTFRIASLLTKDKYISFIAALFVCFSYFNLELISGSIPVEHNDAVFVFYVTASIWAYTEYLHSNAKMKWAIIIGIFAGGAILVKWLTGLLVYSAWGLSILLSIRTREGRREILYYVSSLCTCVLVFLPWQLYILRAFPVEAKHEYAFNVKHLTEKVEDMHSDVLHYFGHMDWYFGDGLWFFLLLGIIVLAMRYKNRLAFSLVFYFLLVFCFFSLVPSQADAFVYIVVPIGFIFIAVSTAFLIEHKYARYLLIPLVLLGVNNVFNYRTLLKRHSPDDNYRLVRMHNNNIYKRLHTLLPPDYKLVLNIPTFEDVNVMFYNNDVTAYSWCLTPRLIDSLIKEGVPVAAFEDHNGYHIDEQLLGYDKFYLIKEQLK